MGYVARHCGTKLTDGTRLLQSPCGDWPACCGLLIAVTPRTLKPQTMWFFVFFASAFQAAFAGIKARCSAQLPAGSLSVAAAAAGGGGGPTPRTTKWPRSLPEHTTAVYAQVVLLHEAGWPNHDIWLQWQAAHEPGSVTLFTHVKVRLSTWAAQRGWQGLYC